MNVVAVFASTLLSLANRFDEPPQQTSSREPNLYQGGNKLFSPFYEICTNGIFHNEPTTAEKPCSEYVQAIPYGRPLFALLQNKNRLTREEEKYILMRILLNVKGGCWEESLPSCVSVLGTRVQMGQVFSFDLATDLISTGFASLTQFSTPMNSPSAHICFFTDPVCARLAMGMMQEGLKLVDDDDRNSGKHPTFWMQKATNIFSKDICSPHRNDIELFACSLYLLFCGDLIRRETSSRLDHFSVPLLLWIRLLRDPTLKVRLDEQDTDPAVSINFIQICHNYLRHSLEQVHDTLLHHWYKAGVATYTYSNCEAFDMVVPVRYKDPQQAAASKYSFCPLLIHVICQEEISKGEKHAAKEAMVDALGNASISVGLCILLLVGLKKNKKQKDENIMFEKISSFTRNGILAFTVEIPVDDPFGVSRFLKQLPMVGGERAEIYASHAQICWSPSVDTKELLRATTTVESDPFRFLSRLKDAHLDTHATDVFPGRKRRSSDAE